jgi:hypothetical protein
MVGPPPLYIKKEEIYGIIMHLPWEKFFLIKLFPKKFKSVFDKTFF